jgi:sugar/nucleoside kinase (ribokinase family)
MEGYILVIGSLNCDMIFLQDRLPEKAETYLGKSASICSGGKGANQAVQAAGAYVVLNAAPAAELSEETLRQVDCLIANEVEASYYLGTAIYSQEDVKNHYQEVLSKVGDAMVITLGDRGSVLCDGTGVYAFTPAPGIQAVETTGSGDSYVGRLLMRNSWEPPIGMPVILHLLWQNIR